MKLLFGIMICLYISADPILIHEEEYELRNDKHGKQIIRCEYRISQNSFIENNQTTEMTLPTEPPIEPEITPSTDNWFDIAGLMNPLYIGIAGCAFFVLYYLKTKFDLYHLGKACVQKAFWSLWRNKAQHTSANDDNNTHLLLDMLTTYQTDEFATAAAHFLQDVDAELNLLQKFVRTAQRSEKSLFSFALPDVTTEIQSAQIKIEKLTRLKQAVIGWLHKEDEIIP